MSRIYLLPEEGQFYKANLHCHSTHSDGRLTPEQLKQAYKDHGYQILAYSDHNVLIPHTDLADPEFLPLTAIEIDTTSSDQPWPYPPTYHLNFFSKDPNRTQFVPFERVYDPEKINRMICSANEAGFLSQYNHPAWSYQDSRDFLPLEGLWGFEVYNHGCELEMSNGYGLNEYDQYVRAGGRGVCVATDDNHNGFPFGNPHSDSFGGFTMIKAPALTYEAVITAMEQKNLYASTGPQITGLYWEDSALHLSCSPCARLYLHTDHRVTDTVLSNGNNLTQAVMRCAHPFAFIRVECVDSAGKRALTRCYCKEELEG